MTDIVLDSVKQSPLYQSLQSNLKSDLSYRITKNLPAISRQKLKISANITPSGVHSSEWVFNLPRFGILESLVLESTITTASNLASLIDNLDAGDRVFGLIELRSHNRVITSNDDAYIKCRKNSASADKNHYYSYIMNSATTFSSDSITVYTPVFFPFFESIYNNLDLTFVEQLQLRCVVNTAGGFGGTLTAISTSLWMNYWNLDSESHASLKAQNFKPDKPLTMLGYDVYTERYNITNGTISTTCNLNVNNCVFESYIYGVDDADSSLYALTTTTLKLSGRTIYDAIPHKLAIWDKAHQEGGAADFLVQAGITTLGGNAYWKNALTFQPKCICWGMDTGNRTYNSGAISFANVNSPQLVMAHADPSATDKDIIVSHSYWKLLSINPSDGRVESFLST